MRDWDAHDEITLDGRWDSREGALQNEVDLIGDRVHVARRAKQRSNWLSVVIMHCCQGGGKGGGGAAP